MISTAVHHKNGRIDESGKNPRKVKHNQTCEIILSVGVDFAGREEQEGPVDLLDGVEGYSFLVFLMYF